MDVIDDLVGDVEDFVDDTSSNGTPRQAYSTPRGLAEECSAEDPILVEGEVDPSLPDISMPPRGEEIGEESGLPEPLSMLDHLANGGIDLEADESTRYTILNILGQGRYGTVYRAVDEETQDIVALKIVEVGSGDVKDLIAEVYALRTCHHESIVRLRQAFYTNETVWLVLDYCDGGTVRDVCDELDKPLPEAVIAAICRNALEAMVCMHENGVVHRDIKAGNMLLTTDGGVRLADFGISRTLEGELPRRISFIGTPYFMAPEVIKQDPCDFRVDVWSLGICAIEMAEIAPPLCEMAPTKALAVIPDAPPPKLSHPEEWGREFDDFLRTCLVKDLCLRPTAQELLQHPFVQSPQARDRSHIVKVVAEYLSEKSRRDAGAMAVTGPDLDTAGSTVSVGSSHSRDSHVSHSNESEGASSLHGHADRYGLAGPRRIQSGNLSQVLHGPFSPISRKGSSESIGSTATLMVNTCASDDGITDLVCDDDDDDNDVGGGSMLENEVASMASSESEDGGGMSSASSSWSSLRGTPHTRRRESQARPHTPHSLTNGGSRSDGGRRASAIPSPSDVLFRRVSNVASTSGNLSNLSVSSRRVDLDGEIRQPLEAALTEMLKAWEEIYKGFSAISFHQLRTAQTDMSRRKSVDLQRRASASAASEEARIRTTS
eukprot:Rmarinus@m.5124